MKLKSNVPLAEFLQTVNLCAGEVLYQTDEGDVLNLKSQLSKYLFLAVLSADAAAPMAAGEINCEDPLDYTVLGKYLVT